MPKRSKPILKDALLWTKGEASSIRVGSPGWYAWLDKGFGFIYQGEAGHFTARSELRRGIPYWYAYRSQAGKFHKTYLGKSSDLTNERLEQACRQLAGQVAQPQLSGSSDSAEWISTLNSSRAREILSTARAVIDPSFMPLTKIHPPTLPQKLVMRPRLTQRISTPITLIVAPSGFGKTTLLNEWRQSCGMPVVWVSLDTDDNNPWRFWSSVTAALQTIHPNLGQDLLPHLQPLSMADLSENVISLTNMIVRSSSEPGSILRFGLVLDDFHHIQDREIHATLQYWLEHLPPTLQLVISTNSRPPLALGHLRARGMVAELDTDDLRFTLEEGIGFLSKHSSQHAMAYSEMQSLIKHTEGWAAGLMLAALALSHPSDQHQFQEAFNGAHPYLREYFVERVLSRLPASVQIFLIKTAILKHLTGPLCDAVTGRADGAETLAHLWQENLFLVRLEEPNWYRYHDLFAETLCSQLQIQFSEEIPHLHRKAAEWYRRQKAPDDAIHHLLAIEAWEEAASLIEETVLHELEHLGDYSRLMRWLRQLPETVVQQHKTLLRVYIRVAALDLSRAEVKQILTRVETNIQRKPQEEQTPDELSVLAEIQRIRQFWLAGDTELVPLSKSGEHDDVWQMLDGIVTYARYVRWDAPKAITVARELYEMARKRSHLYVMLVTGGGLAYFMLLQGDLRGSERIAHEVLQHAITKRGKLPEAASIPLTMLSRLCYERNQLDLAHQLLLRVAEADPNPTSSNMPVMEAIQRAKLEFAQGDAAAALATIQTARELQARHPAGLYRDLDLIAYQAWFCVRQGDCTNAERLLNEAGEVGKHAFLTLVRAMFLLEEKRPGKAVVQLRSLIREYPHGLYLEPALGARITLAIAFFEQRQVNAARQMMAGAVRLACPEGFLRPFLDYGRSSASLLSLVLNTTNLTAEAQTFVGQVLHLLGISDGARTDLSEAELAALSTAASITARELEVLRLVSAGFTNREIAAHLSLAESTVKTHLKNIYRKLKVNNRTRAIAQARELKLV